MLSMRIGQSCFPYTVSVSLSLSLSLSLHTHTHTHDLLPYTNQHSLPISLPGQTRGSKPVTKANKIQQLSATSRTGQASLIVKTRQNQKRYQHQLRFFDESWYQHLCDRIMISSKLFQSTTERQLPALCSSHPAVISHYAVWYTSRVNPLRSRLHQ